MELNPRKKYLQDARSVSQMKRDMVHKGLNVINSAAHNLRNLCFSLPGSIPQQSFCLRVYELHIYTANSRSRAPWGCGTTMQTADILNLQGGRSPPVFLHGPQRMMEGERQGAITKLVSCLKINMCIYHTCSPP